MYIFRVLYQYFEENYFSATLENTYENISYTQTATTLLMLVGGLAIGILIASFAAVFQKKVIGKFIRRLLTEKAHTPESAKSLADLGLEKSGVIKHELSRLSVSRKLIAIVQKDGSVSTYRDEIIAAFPEFAEQIEASFADKAQEAGAAANEDVASKQAVTDGAEKTESAPLIPEADMVKEKEPDERTALTKTKDFFFEKKFKLSKPDFASARFFIPEDLRHRAELRFREKGNSAWFLVLAVLLVLILFFAALAGIPFLVKMLDATVGNFKGL